MPGIHYRYQPWRSPNAVSFAMLRIYIMHKKNAREEYLNGTEVQVLHWCHFVFPHLSSLPGYLRQIASRASALLNEPFFGGWVRMMLNRGVENNCVHLSWYCVPIDRRHGFLGDPIIKEVKLHLSFGIILLPGVHIQGWLWGLGTTFTFKFKHMHQAWESSFTRLQSKSRAGEEETRIAESEDIFSLLHGCVRNRIYWHTPQIANQQNSRVSCFQANPSAW